MTPTIRAAIVVSLIGAVCTTGSTGAGASGQGPDAQRADRTGRARPPRLFKDSRALLALARVRGHRDISLLIAAHAGASEAIVRRATELGGTVRYRDDDVGYLRVRVPLDRVVEFSALDAIEALTAEIDEGGRSPSPDADSTSQSNGTTDSQWPPRLNDYPLQQPYSPHKDLDADVFLARQPTWDGRGVTVAVLDGHVDWLLPELQMATAADGRPVPKFADVINATDPRDDAEEMPQWVDMREQVTSQGGRLTYQGKTMTVPRDGAYRIGFFSERRFDNPANAAYISKDIDRNGNPKDDDGLFGVLWDEATNEIWVDVNRSLSFADDRVMTDYRVRHDLGTFGTDKPETPVRESIGFTLQTDSRNKFISINVGLYQHGTMVVGALAGNRRPHGRYDGVAPGSQVISIFYGVSIAHGMIEALIAAFKDPRVDLVLLEQNSTVGDDYQLADGRNPLSILVNRMIGRYQKLMLVPGSNAPGLGLVDEPGLASKAISVGGYQSKDSYRRNWGFVPAQDDNMHWGGLSHGPAGDGALKPDVLSPSGHLGNDPGYRMGSTLKGLYQLPPGYTMGGGTSEATPVATGAFALLISAAKQAGVPYDAQRLKAAVTSSARWIPRLGAFEQGNGLIQVGAAWEMLRNMAKAPSRVVVTSRGPVRTVLSHLLATPDEGAGLYEREGWTPGSRGDRMLTFTRDGGPAEPMTFALSWQGNDGTFSSAASVVLPLGKPVALPVTVAAGSAGVHSAVLSLTHPSQPGHVHRVLNTIVVAEPFKPEQAHRVRFEGEVPRPGDRGFYVYVPPGAAAVKVDASPKGVALRLSLLPPDRTQYKSVTSTTPGDLSLTVERPMPGVWEINLWNGQDARNFDPSLAEAVPPTPVTVTAMLAGVDVTATKNGSAGGFTLTGSNRFGTLPAAFTHASLGSAARTRRTINEGEQQASEVEVPKGSDAIWAQLSRATATADLDLYLFDCSGKTCEARASSTTTGSDERVFAAKPAAGRWVIVVDGFGSGARSVDYEYLDVASNPTFGSVHVADIADARQAGATWKAEAHVWVATAPPAPRRPFAFVPVVSTAAQTVDSFSSPPRPALLGFIELTLGSMTSDGR